MEQVLGELLHAVRFRGGAGVLRGGRERNLRLRADVFELVHGHSRASRESMSTQKRHLQHVRTCGQRVHSRGVHGRSNFLDASCLAPAGR